MQLKVILKRGQEVNLPALDEGEMAFAKDTNIVFIGSPNNGGNIPINKNFQYVQFHDDLKRQTALANLSIDYSVGAGGQFVLTSAGTISFSHLQKGKSYVLQVSGDFPLSFPGNCQNISNMLYEGGGDTYFIFFYCVNDSSGSELVVYTVNKIY